MKVFLAVRLAGQVTQTHFLKLRRHIRVGYLQIIIGVVAAQRGHGEDFPGLAVHHQPEGPILHVIAPDGSLHLLFQAGLHRGVQCQNHAVALLGGHVVFIGKGHIHLIIALGGDDPPGPAGEVAVIGRLHPLTAVAGGIGEADDLGRQAAAGIHPPGGRLQMDAGNVLRIDVVPDFGSGFLADKGTHLLIALPGVSGLFRDPRRVFFQNFPQRLSQIPNVRLGLLQLVGV